MRKLRDFFKKDSKKLTFAAGLLVAVVGLVGSFGITASRAGATGVDCDNNAIIKCGFDSASAFISDVKSNNSGNGHNDLQAIYNHFGLSSSDYNRFVSSAQAGDLYRDGHLVVAGKTVATGMKSIGRIASYHGSDYFTETIPGAGTYYGNVVDKTFASGVTSLPVYVLFDSTGNVEFTVMKACGNPAFGTVVKTTASCSALTQTPVAGQLNTYNFTASAAHSSNATITKYVYNFGDGSAPVTETNGAIAVKHTYAKAGTFTATVTVYASVPGNSNLQLPAVSLCAKTITVKLPFYSCVQMVGAILDKSKMSYSFTVTANSGNGATFTGADFDFGDSKTQTGVKPTTATTVVVTHSYAAAGTYNASATLHFSVNGQDVTAPTCKALVTPQTVTPECKPGVPVGSAACTPCQYNNSIPSNSPQCTPPPAPELPNTGAGNVVAIFAAVVVAGFLGYRQLLFRRHRAAFVAAEQGSSPLPLADPMSDTPLAGTPLARKKFTSFRRRRPF